MTYNVFGGTLSLNQSICLAEAYVFTVSRLACYFYFYNNNNTIIIIKNVLITVMLLQKHWTST